MTTVGTAAGAAAGTAPASLRLAPTGWRRFFAIGSGVGIQIEGPRGAESARVAAARVRPGGAKLLGELTIDDLPHQPAAAWGMAINAFLRKHGLQNVVATVLLPRRDVIVRAVHMPGVAPKDLPAALQFQMDGLHPYADDDVVSSWSRLPGTSWVLVAIARRDVVERYAMLFQEAGVRVGSISCSAAAIYSALRVFGLAPQGELMAVDVSPQGVEVYGESAARPVFSGSFPLAGSYDSPEEVDLTPATIPAAAELRLTQAPSPVRLGELLGCAQAAGRGAQRKRNSADLAAASESPQRVNSVREFASSEPALAFASALVSARPRRSLRLNLLPVEHRRTGSKMVWIPAAILGLAVVALAVALAMFPAFENRRYGQTLAAQIAQVQPAALRAGSLDREIEAVRRRTQVLDDVRKRSRADMDALNELTRLLPPPTWLNLLELNATQFTIAGETDQAAGLLRTIDASPLFENSEFVMPPLRIQGGEGFRVRFHREGARP